MADTEGSEIHTGELQEAIKVEVGTQVYFTIRSPAPLEINGVPVVGVNYDSLGEDLEVGDHIIVDGGMCELVVTAKAGPDVLAGSIEQGLLLSKANLTFRWVEAARCVDPAHVEGQRGCASTEQQ
ncbi:hypothetical protein COO60DRAFT_775160 [Scenedesmus sp. NREL 46B-D3]|nr:hypothetical protein COO60DRAFT_775160 [Scenedesmus sp. NREL 46B-D3]